MAGVTFLWLKFVCMMDLNNLIVRIYGFDDQNIIRLYSSITILYGVYALYKNH